MDAEADYVLAVIRARCGDEIAAKVGRPRSSSR
jgi:hypothetical protein